MAYQTIGRTREKIYTVQEKTNKTRKWKNKSQTKSAERKYKRQKTRQRQIQVKINLTKEKKVDNEKNLNLNIMCNANLNNSYRLKYYTLVILFGSISLHVQRWSMYAVGHLSQI